MIDENDFIFHRNIIMEHYTNPNNKGLENGEGIISEEQESQTCSDKLTIQLKIDNNKIVKAKFDGIACAISTASTDILCDQLIDKTSYEAINFLENFYNLVVGKKCNKNELDELIAFSKIYEQQNRINCCLLGTNGFKNMILKFNNKGE